MAWIRQKHTSYFIIALLYILCRSSLFVVNAFQLPINWHKNVRRTQLHAVEGNNGNKNDQGLSDLKVAIVGGGPSGLLLAHKLLAGGSETVHMFEARSRPREISKEPRAYALGVGIRGRTAIQSVDMSLWQAIKNVGFASERFDLHVGPLRLRLRDGTDAKSAQQEPSLLLYQTDLCRALCEELERRWSNPKFNIQYNTRVTNVDLESRTLTTSDNSKHGFDLVVGCDGVNSVIRQAIDHTWPAFEASRQDLPGEFKVFQLPMMPPKLDSTAVSLLLPKAGACTAFVEPTADKGCCVLLAGRKSEDNLLSINTEDEIKDEITKRFPLLEGVPLEEAARQLANTETSKAASVVCNIYHFSNVVALVGDAAHATGGVSGQGVNSALVDSQILAESLLSNYRSTSKEETLKTALLHYSRKQVPEGKALYDLSFGPPETSSRWQRIALRLATFRDSIFKGRLGIGNLPLQTMLTTSLIPFAEIRRQRDPFFPEAFPSPDEWNRTLANLSEL